MRFPRNFADEVRNQADIVRIISDYVALKKTGSSWKACCPFHNEKTPSFNVHAGKQVFKCFGCGVAGDVFGFIRQMERCTFPEAIKTVAEKCGIPIPQVEDSEDYKQAARERDDLLQLNEWAAQFFQEQLGMGAEGKRAEEYLDGRGISTDTRRLMRLGYAPQSWDALLTELKRRGAENALIEKSGLVTIRDNGIGYYDRFRGRVMFPISDAQGRVIAFGGRILGQGEPKYLNSPETPVYSKGRNLFGLNFAKDDIRKRDAAILVEGYLDFTIPFQSGVRNMIASLGTALTEQQVKLLARYTRRIVVNYDPDSAGISATKRSLEMLLAVGFKVNVLSLPDGMDPDEYVLKNGGDAYRDRLKKSVPYMDYIIEQSIKEHDMSRPGGKAETLNAILPYMHMVKNKVERSEYAGLVADRLKIEDRVVLAELKRAVDGRQNQLDETALKSRSTLLPAEKQLLGLITNHDGVRKTAMTALSGDEFEGLRGETIFHACRHLAATGAKMDFGCFSSWISENQIEDEELIEYLLPTVLLEGADAIESRDENDLISEARACISALRRNRMQRELERVRSDIRQAERSGDQTKLFELLTRQTELQKNLPAA
jgi:DNA primase